jgi:hypothetical protein
MGTSGNVGKYWLPVFWNCYNLECFNDI